MSLLSIYIVCLVFCLYQCEFMDLFLILWCIINTIIILLLKSFHLWPWKPVSFAISPSTHPHFFKSISLLLGIIWYIRLILYFPCLALESNGIYLQIKVLLLLVCLLHLGSLFSELGYEYMYNNPCIHTVLVVLWPISGSVFYWKVSWNSKVIIFMVYYIKRIQSKISKTQKYIGWSLEKLR